MQSVSPVLLMILDGWGIRQFEQHNAVTQANTPNFDRWLKKYERAIVDASGLAVGLPDGQMGNSEVGHTNLGAGRVVYQDIVKIDLAIKSGEIYALAGLNKAIDAMDAQNNLHIIGLLGTGGVHSHLRHQKALLMLAKKRGKRAILHLITDGRDTPQESALGFLEELNRFITANEIDAQVVSLSGRYYTMDRDKRWERIKRGYDVIVQAGDKTVQSAEIAIQTSYNDGITDEFIAPVLIGDERVPMSNGDVVIFFNFRADRMRQIVAAFADSDFSGFATTHPHLNIFTMTNYEPDLPVSVLFDKDNVTMPLAEVVSKAGLLQYHTAETEKYPHVTYFFNGGREEPFANETHKVVPSPKVATYDLQPEMSAYELTAATLERLTTHNDSFLLINFANPDMVGHTGDLAAAVKAVETVDACAQVVIDVVLAKGGVAIVTADHGNCEIMLDELTGEPHTYHTTNPVHLFVMGANTYYGLLPRGILADVAPTVLHLLGLEQPAEMTGRSLVVGARED
jgi:2,3-bisphosphoglycerate-independent phosphoglycerate mutase